MTLTLQIIRDHSPCTDGWKKLIKAIGSDLNTELSIGDVLISNGLDDALWCLQCLEPRQRVAAVMPAVKRASVHATDKRVHDCIAAIEQWLAGDDAVDINAAARSAAEAAEAAKAAEAEKWAAAWAAEAAAQAVGETTWAATWAATWTAGTAARAELAAGTAELAARTAARAARAAEHKLQESDLLVMFPPMNTQRKGEMT